MVFIKPFALFFLSILTLSAAMAESDSWKTLTTPHFKIIIADKFPKQEQHIAKQAERALDQLRSIYSEFPKSKILIVVDHRTNASNGSATHFPYPHIIIYPALPTTYSSIGEYNEWVYELILHELVHFLTFYPNHGIYRPVQWLFGNLFAPNFILLPSWFHEGLAVSLETHLSTGGRMRSEHYKEMSKVLAQKLKTGEENLSSINERSTPSFPYGQRPYFFGSLVVNESTKNQSADSLNQMIQGFSRAIPPYNINSSVKKNLNQSFVSARKAIQIPNQVNQETEKKYQKEFIFEGHSPIWLNSKSFLTLRTTPNLFQEIVQYDLTEFTKPKKKVLTSLLGAERINLSSDSNKLVFTQLFPYQKMYNTTDIFIYDFKTKKQKRLTFGAKLRDAAFSKSVEQIVAVQTNLTNTRLVKLNVSKPETITLLYRPQNIETRITSPNFINNDTEIIFLEKEVGQPTKLKILNVKSNLITVLDFAEHFEKIFWVENQKDQLVVHAKEISKPRQHYVLDKDFQPTQITFDKIGTRSAALNKKQVLVTHLSSKDYVTAWYPDFKSETSADLNDYDIRLSKNLLFQDKNAPGLKSKKTKIKELEYSFLDYMLPQYWFPFITPNYGGFSSEFSTSISTGSSDPLGINSYSANLRQDTISNRLSGGVNFFHQDKNLVWGLYANQFESPLNEEFSRTIQSLAVSTRYDFGHARNLGHALTIYLSHTDARLESIQQIKSFGPELTYNFNSLMQAPSELVPGLGQFANISVSHFLDIDNYFSYNFLDAYYEAFFSRYKIIPKQTSLKVFGKALASDQVLPTVFSPVNLSGYFMNSRQQSSFVIRGYPSGVFQANEAAYTLGLEYYFPIFNVFSGPESLPVFFRRLYGTLVADMGSFKGRVFDGASASFQDHSFEETYYGAGFELHLDLTVGHYVPLKLSLGVYNALNPLDGIEPTQVFFNFTTPALP